MLGNSRTVAEQDRIDAIHERGCVPCWRESILVGRSWLPEPCDIHHVEQDDWSMTYGNCPWHHRAICKGEMNEQVMRGVFGPSMAKEPGQYHERYGSEGDLLALQSELLLKSDEAIMRTVHGTR